MNTHMLLGCILIGVLTKSIPVFAQFTEVASKPLTALRVENLDKKGFEIGKKSSLPQLTKSSPPSNKQPDLLDGQSSNQTVRFEKTMGSIRQSIQTKRGGVAGGGGDEVGVDFEMSLYSGLKRLEFTDPNSFIKMNYLGLNKLLKKVKFIVVEDDLKVIATKDTLQNSVAVNDRKTKVIYIQRARWAAITDTNLKEGIAIHEIASLLGIERTGAYKISAKYIAEAGFPFNKISKTKKDELIIRPASGTSLSFSCTLLDFIYYPQTKHFILTSVNDATLKEFYGFFNILQINQSQNGDLKIEALVSDGPYYTHYGTRTELDLQFVSLAKASSNDSFQNLNYNLKVRIVREDDHTYLHYQNTAVCQVTLQTEAE
ncbi:MAG: hypothetical protein A2622_07495 [Bdellovibrionales bacterium RIFCSPHIGHO2_01_FULL_40_29]|nr:MAG: hypothetical protein A2622_07495 [Bdellovibrionales bacterium RIFCSPHIGHO2_01_FULL_40_29]OFZ34233.1 MAG: hypothetical protein A3D17_04155 [Bdellovibrionales bacterium RIFCSPHIGHO2_02_FULL_40_15]